MIIRITVHDSKYINTLKMFSNAMKDCELYYDEDRFVKKDESEEEIRSFRDRYSFENLHHLLIENDISESQKSDYVTMLKSKFKYFCLEYPFSNVSKKDYETIESRLNISIISSLTPRNENNEVLYIVPSRMGMYNQTVIL